jgi:peptidoglycan/xylan/chitin deacetylase (PgdA/CDA1 family)
MNKADLIQSSKLHKVFKPFYSGIGHIFMFHRVCNENDYIITKDLQVTPEYLENVLKYFIYNNIDIVTLDECYNRITAKGKVKRFAVFTFDDGYADNLTHALPVFEKYNAPFALFLATGYPDYKIVLWWYLLEYLVLNNSSIKFNEGGDTYFYNTLTLDEKRDAFSKIRRYIRESNHKNLLSRLKTIFNSYYYDLFELTKKLALSWEQVIELSNHSLVTIGAHTVNHLVLSKLTENEVMKEINESVKIIERKTGKPVLYLAYPFGGNNEASVREFNIAGNCSVKMAFTAKNGNIFKRHAHHLTALPRIGINESWSISHIDLYINGLTPFLNNFR